MSKTCVRFDLNDLGTPVEGAPLPERVLAGTPRNKTWILDETPDGKQFSGIWECSPGKWACIYEEWEFCSFLSGHLIVTEDGGAPETFRAGDSVVFRPGWRGTWEVVETTRKIFVARYP